jgi:hypothetical protein
VLSRTVFDATAVVLPFNHQHTSSVVHLFAGLSIYPPIDLSTPTHVAYACVRVCVCSSIHLHTYPCSYEISVDLLTHSINAIHSSNLFKHFWSPSTLSSYSSTSLLIPILEVFDANLNINKKISIKIKLYITKILSLVLYGCETWSLTLREERRLRVF